MNLIVNQINYRQTDQEREFYNKLIQEWIDNNNFVMYSTHNECKLVIAEKFVKTLKTLKIKIYKK